MKIHNTQQKVIHSKIFWPQNTILILKSAKYQNLQKFKIFKVKTDLSPELMSYIFEFIKIIILANKFAVQSRESKWQNMAQKHEKYDIEPFSNECEAII